MSPRLTRAEQTERNRSAVLSAARRVFLARGYHGATLEQIADEAGFSKGVVYSQFGTKADLFLVLLEFRIDDRARLNAELAADLAGEPGLAALFEHAAWLERSEPEWTRLVIEFRVQAARDPELNRRYAAAHERAVAGVAAGIAELFERSGDEPPFPPRNIAELIFAMRSGFVLEQTANPDALQNPPITELMARLFAPTVGARVEVS